MSSSIIFRQANAGRVIIPKVVKLGSLIQSPCFRKELLETTKLEKDVRKTKILEIRDKLKEEVEVAKSRFVKTLMSYNRIAEENLADSQKCKESAEVGVAR